MTKLLSPPRPDLDSHDRAVTLALPVLVEELREHLGARLVAYLGGVRETRAVRQWVEGTREVQGELTERRLRLSYQVAELVARRDSDGVVQAWFQGLNPHLGDRSPARVLVTGDLDEDGPKVLAAARAFAATG